MYTMMRRLLIALFHVGMFLCCSTVVTGLSMGSTSADYKVQNNQISSQNEEIVGQQCQHLQRQGHNQAVQKENHLGMSVQMMMGQAATRQLAKSAVLVMAAMVLGTGAVHADEYGRETEAPTMFTGETTMICVKRGPLGACTKTEIRTAENDNDKSDSYFRQPTGMAKLKAETDDDSPEGNALIERLKKQSEDNREINELIIQQKTFMNDKSASFGPFDGQVLIMNEDGRGFTLLENPQAMRLKNDGFIKDRRFIKQPTAEELEKALVNDNPGFLDRFFGQ